MPELLDDEAGSPWPWLLAVASGIGLLALSWQQVRAIPASLEHQAATIATRHGFHELSLSVSGRDLDISGILPADADRSSVLEELKAIPGMRVVRSDISLHDPAAAAEARLADFRKALSGIDTRAIAFEPGSSSFTDGSADALAAVADLLLANPDFRVRIAGHTDNTGRSEVNLRISRERADAVLHWLQSRGVRSSQMITQGLGQTRPIADNATKEGRALNRRIEFTYID